MKQFILSVFAFTVLLGCKSNYPDLEPGLYADIQTDKGTILIKLATEKAPITVANFVSLSEGENPKVSEEYQSKRFYDGLKFHRVIKDFMIQGGDPLGNGSGNPGYRFDDEFSDLTHDGPGILSMANSGPATNGSQFFITHKATPWLDGKHTVFGAVVEGQAVVDSIEQNDVIQEIKIIRKGSDARKFDAPKIFEDYFENREAIAKEKEAKKAQLSEQNATKFEALKEQAQLTSSGLQYIITEKGTGKNVTSTNVAMVHYAVYFVDGTLLETSNETTAINNDAFNLQKQSAGMYEPIEARVGPEDRMIEGFKEGIRLLKEGDKATLFLPYTLAYGEGGTRGIPPKSDLIFEVEVISIKE
ncbi:MAG: peptidylprolyl isomerase [Flavobacteriaceae bacterium]